MRKGLTELVFILDRSGSMSGLEDDTIGGFNALIKKQKKVEGNAFISTILFDDEIKFLHDRIDLKKIESITEKDYYVGGCTALLDAIGMTMNHIQNIHKYAREEDVPEKTMFIITTDGMENSSKHFTFEQVNKLVKKKQRECDWDFIFLGANIDAVATASKIGIHRENATNYTYDGAGIKCCYQNVSNAVSALRKEKNCENKVCIPDYLKPIHDDFISRG